MEPCFMVSSAQDSAWTDFMFESGDEFFHGAFISPLFNPNNACYIPSAAV